MNNDPDLFPPRSSELLRFPPYTGVSKRGTTLITLLGDSKCLLFAWVLLTILYRFTNTPSHA